MVNLPFSIRSWNEDDHGRATLHPAYWTLIMLVIAPSTNTWSIKEQLTSVRAFQTNRCLTLKWIFVHTKMWLSSTLTSHSHSQVSSSSVRESSGPCPRETTPSWIPSLRKSSMINLPSQMLMSSCINSINAASTPLPNGNAAYAVLRDCQRTTQPKVAAPRRTRRSDWVTP